MTERSIVVPRDEEPFAVDKTQWVRLTGKGITGSKIEAEVEGPAKLDTESFVLEMTNGGVVIGNTIKEFEVKPTGSGKVTVTVTSTPPSDSKSKVTVFKFEVK